MTLNQALAVKLLTPTIENADLIVNVMEDRRGRVEICVKRQDRENFWTSVGRILVWPNGEARTRANALKVFLQDPARTGGRTLQALSVAHAQAQNFQVAMTDGTMVGGDCYSDGVFLALTGLNLGDYLRSSVSVKGVA